MAASQERPWIAACAIAATAKVVATTSPIESSEIGLRFARRSRNDEKNEAE